MADSSSKKEWYKTTWGIILAILFLPFFIVWYVWAKSKLSQVWKIVITAVIGVMFITAIANEPKTTTTTTPTSTPASTPTSPTYIYDIPSLIGKNIDEVRVALGQPLDKSYIEPTEEQKKLGMADGEWDNTFKKDDFELLVTFNPSNRKIVDFFVGTSTKYPDKNKLMEATNTKENAGNYTIEAVKALKNPSTITGIKSIPK